MKDPGPNPVELLTAILAATGNGVTAAVPGPAVNPTLWPAMFYWKGDPQLHMKQTGTNNFSVAIEDDDEHALCGHRNIRMITDDSSPAGNDRVEIRKSLPLPTSSLVRLQFAMAFPYTNTNRSYEIQMEHFDGTDKYTAWWRLACGSPATPQVQYKNSGSVWTVIPGFVFCTGDLYWNKVDITMNIADHTQHNVTVNDQSTDLSHEAFYSAGVAEPPRVELMIRLIITTAQTHTLYLDHILVTAPALEAS